MAVIAHLTASDRFIIEKREAKKTYLNQPGPCTASSSPLEPSSHL
jgi:hypothetical protein